MDSEIESLTTANEHGADGSLTVRWVAVLIGGAALLALTVYGENEGNLHASVYALVVLAFALIGWLVGARLTRGLSATEALAAWLEGTELKSDSPKAPSDWGTVRSVLMFLAAPGVIAVAAVVFNRVEGNGALLGYMLGFVLMLLKPARLDIRSISLPQWVKLAVVLIVCLGVLVLMVCLSPIIEALHGWITHRTMPMP